MECNRHCAWTFTHMYQCAHEPANLKTSRGVPQCVPSVRTTMACSKTKSKECVPWRAILTIWRAGHRRQSAHVCATHAGFCVPMHALCIFLSRGMRACTGQEQGTYVFKPACMCTCAVLHHWLSVWQAVHWLRTAYVLVVHTRTRAHFTRLVSKHHGGCHSAFCSRPAPIPAGRQST